MKWNSYYEWNKGKVYINEFVVRKDSFGKSVYMWEELRSMC